MGLAFEESKLHRKSAEEYASMLPAVLYPFVVSWMDKTDTQQSITLGSRSASDRSHWLKTLRETDIGQLQPSSSWRELPDTDGIRPTSGKLWGAKWSTRAPHVHWSPRRLASPGVKLAELERRKFKGDSAKTDFAEYVNISCSVPDSIPMQPVEKYTVRAAMEGRRK